jgi:hypothetical protein
MHGLAFTVAVWAFLNDVSLIGRQGFDFVANASGRIFMSMDGRRWTRRCWWPPVVVLRRLGISLFDGRSQKEPRERSSPP